METVQGEVCGDKNEPKLDSIPTPTPTPTPVQGSDSIFNFFRRGSPANKRKSHKPLGPSLSADSVASATSVGSVGSSTSADSSPEINNNWIDLKKSTTYDHVKVKGTKIVVSVVLIEATGLPDPTEDSNHSMCCKIGLGSETYKSKSVQSSSHPKWCQKFQLNLVREQLLKISLWDKGKMKNSMGSCVIDLSRLATERTHEIRRDLSGGYGILHLCVTMCTVKQNGLSVDLEPQNNIDVIRKDIAFYNPETDWKVVGSLKVKVLSAKGFTRKINSYCTLELDNESVRTPSDHAAEPEWNKSFDFTVYDVTSTLKIKVYEDSYYLTSRKNCIGRLTIPLLTIRNGEAHWYALKDRSQKANAKGNCPRLLLHMTVIWDPVKASLRMLRPKEVKHIEKKPAKFDVGLIYSNLEFMKDTFDVLYEINEAIKVLFEWENREKSTIAVIVWLLFWYNFQYWTAPLLVLIPFLFHYVMGIQTNPRRFLVQGYKLNDDDIGDKYDTTIKRIFQREKVQNIPELTLTITGGIEYLVSVVEKLYNLITFKVPFLSYVAMVFLLAASFGLYYIPVNYIMMSLGLYKYMRKYLNPTRKLNNDVLDFISRVPDNKELRELKELQVPEPR